MLLALLLQVIVVQEDDWGGASREDLRKVLESAASRLVPHFKDRTFAPIHVGRSKESPITLYKKGPKGETLVRLNSEGAHWAQFAYQFAHELGHILCRYDEHGDKPNQWLEETLCETASLFALRRMGEEWKERPPYTNWRDYATSLTAYADERIRKAALPEGVKLADWFRENEPAMRAKAELREKNTVVAAALLPLFEKEPERWEALGWLPRGKAGETRTLRQYLRDWSAAVPEKHRTFIGRIGALLGAAPE